MRKLATKGIILRRINFGEADRILTVITPEQGKLSLIAKGSRRSKSKLAGGLELFSVSDIDYIDGRGEVKTIVSARLDRHFTDVVGDIDTTMQAYDFLKVIDEHTQESCEEQFFYILEHALQSLQDHGSLLVTKTWFYVQMLMHTGRSINTEAQVDGRPFSETGTYHFDFDTMGFVESTQGKFLPKHIKFLRLLEKADTPAHLLKVDHADGLAKDLLRLLEQCVKYG